MRVASGVRQCIFLGIFLAIATAAAPLQAIAQSPAAPEIVKYELAANQDTPELCFVVDQTMPRQPESPFDSFIVTEPAAKLSAVARDDRLCLTGLAFGVTYTVTLKAGLPGVSGVLAKDAQFRIQVPDRPPELDFASRGSTLPRLSDGLPIRSVNVPRIDAEIFHISDRDLMPEGSRSKPLAGDMAAALPLGLGDRVWHGVVETKGEANQDTVTNLALDKTIGGLKPGLYVAVARPAGTSASPGKSPSPTQYFTVSDLGLTAYRARDGLAVAVRSLATAAAVPGIDIALIARNNRELTRARTDDSGLARFDPAVLRGTAGDQPASLYAYGAAGEFGMLSIDTLAVSKLPQVRIYPDHTLYHPGGTVGLLALARNFEGPAGSKMPLTIAVHRPDGTLYRSLSLEDQGAGGYTASVVLPGLGAEGRWRIDALGGNAPDGNAPDGNAPDGNGRPVIGSAEVVVAPEDARLTVGVGAEAALLDPDQPAAVTVQTQFRGGQAATGTPGELRVRIGPAANAFPAFPGFSFGLDGHGESSATIEPIHFTTDGGGKATVPVRLGPLPRTTKPLEAAILARVLDLDGHAIERAITVPVAAHPLLLGIKSPPDGIVPEGQPAHFEVVALSPDGARQEKAGVGWEIAREDFAPSWFWDGARFAYRPATKDTTVAGGAVDVPANASGMVDATLPAGRYRVTLYDPKGEAASSVRFVVGWAPPLADRPSDAITLAPAKPSYGPGEGADIFVRPPFESDIILGAADRDIRSLVVQHIPAAGGMIHLDIPRDASDGLRLVATALAPPAPIAPGLPRRATGTGVLSPDSGRQKLDVKLELPERAQPDQTPTVAVTVSGMSDEPTFVAITLAGVKEDGPAPAAGEDNLPSGAPGEDRAMPDLPATDVYGSIITPSGLSNGDRRRRRDSSAASGPAVPDAASNISWSSGIIALDKTGKAAIPIRVPDFAGTLRLRAIAWSPSRTGEVQADLPVRNPLAVGLPMPGFLLPDDRADLTLALENTDGPRGEYHVALHATGSVALQDESEIIINLAEHEQRSQPVAIVAHNPGPGTITIGVKGPNGIAFERHLALIVQPPGPKVWRHATATVKPGGSFALDPALIAGLRPESIAISVTASAGGDFDLSGIARELTDSDYGSAERIVDQAAPLLMPPALAQALGLAAGEANAGLLRRAVDRVLQFQTADGGFSLWGTGASDPWLSAYVAEFLGRATTSGATVPSTELDRAMDYLMLHREPDLGQGVAEPSPPALAAAAYANKVLAGNGRLDLYQLRYFADRFAAQLRAPATLGLLASAFAALDDKAAAASFFAQALSLPGNATAPDGFASELRDQAMLAAVMAESGAVAQPLVASALGKAAATAAGRRQFAAEESAWIFRAQSAMVAGTGAVSLKAGDHTLQQNGAVTLAAKPGESLPPVKNQADVPLRLSVTVTGLPSGPESSQPGYEIQRAVYDVSGKPVDPATVHQYDVLVVVLTGHFTGQGEPRPVVVDPVPAGWTVEAAALIDPADRYPWLKDLTSPGPAMTEGGEYVAAPVPTGERHDFKLAYVVRASVRGQFAMPGTWVEDMVQPAFSARLGSTRTKIDAPAL